MKTPIDEIYDKWLNNDVRYFDKWFASNHIRLNKELMEMIKDAWCSGFEEPLPFARFEDYIDGVKDTDKTN